MVTIIIPAYNVENYISECLESIVNQTYKNLEIIIINDGSTDRTGEIIESYVNKYSNIKYIYQNNKGVSNARNLGLSHANGEYIMFIDSDDYIDVDLINNMVKKSKQNDADLVITGHIRVSEDSLIKKEIINLDEYSDNIYSREEGINLLLRLKIKGYLCDKLFKKDILIKSGFYLEPNRYIEDWLPVFRYVLNCNKIVFSNQSFYYYRQRSSSALHTINEKLLDDYIYAVKNIDDFLEKNKLEVSKKCKQVFEAETFYSIARYFYIINNNKYKDKIKLYKDFSIYANNLKIRLNKSFYLNNLIDIKLKMKIFLWNLRIFHIFYKI